MAKKVTLRRQGRRTRTSKPKMNMSTRRAPPARGGRRAASRAVEIGGMTVREAGRKGGLIGGRKGGLTLKAERGREFYQEIGRKGGQRVRDLIAAGKSMEERPAGRRHT